MAQEIIHSIRKKGGKKGWMVVKIDLEKAYDKIDWSFIEEMLTNIGIPGNIQRIIMHCVNSSTMQVV